MKASVLVVFLALASWSALPARADTMRCGSSLIAVGAVAAEVAQKCGEPDSRMELSEPIRARRPDGTSYVVGTATREIWHYQRRSGQFPADLTFEGGVLKRIDFEK
jgi:Protein of unknown function (DUF2845)